jgi:hypothetical protein
MPVSIRANSSPKIRTALITPLPARSAPAN